MNTAFLTKLASAETKVVTKGGAGSRTSSHEGDIYINKQGRLFGISSKHNERWDIENGEVDGVKFIKVRLSKPTGTDEKGKKTWAKTSFKTSAESTGTPFITITKLCKDLFGKDKELWDNEFQKQGEQDGYIFYTLMERVEKPAKEKKEDKASDKKSTK